jgi:hypothetical protein
VSLSRRVGVGSWGGALLAVCLSLSACSDEPSPSGVAEAPSEVSLLKDDEGKSDSSAVAVFLDFSFSGRFTSSSDVGLNRLIEQQLLYTIGHLNGDRSVGRLDKLKLSNVLATRLDAGGFEITYDATLPVAWGQRDRVPKAYTFRLPYDTTYAGLERFTERHKASCVDYSAHDVDSGSMWYYYRPDRPGCVLAEGEVVTSAVVVSPSATMTSGRYPEYHKVWEDEALRATLIFGMADEERPTADAGVDAYQTFYRLARQELTRRGALDLKVTPEVGEEPTLDQREVQLTGTLPDGRVVELTALLVTNVRTAGAAFDARYHELSATADLIVYNGHAGLGANVRALARKGDWQAGQYAVVFMNGCDTFAYVDEALFEAHAAVNPEDPTGRGHVDIINNAMPAYFFSMAPATMALVGGLLSYESPLTYEQMFAQVDRNQVVLVTGEEDNLYTPGYDPTAPAPPVAPWAGLSEELTLVAGDEWRAETPALEAGAYRFAIEGEGDADLYVRVGVAPTATEYDCRPYRAGSVEACEVELTAPGAVHVMVRGFSPRSRALVVGGALKGE